MRKIITTAVILAMAALNIAWAMSVLPGSTIAKPAETQINDSGFTRTPVLW